MPEQREDLDRRAFLGHAAVLGAAAAGGMRFPGAVGLPAAPAKQPAPAPAPPRAAFELEEVTVAELQAGMSSGRYTARHIVELYLGRIAAMDRADVSLQSIIETNPDALTRAEELDRERATKGPRGPLHGIPVLLKDNIDTADRMTTTAGSLALEGSIPPRDSHIAERLRAAGAILLAKANLSEWANIRSNHSSSGWSGRGDSAGTRTCSTAIPAARARGRRRRCLPTSGRWRSAPRPTGRSSAQRRPTAWSGSSRRSVW